MPSNGSRTKNVKKRKRKATNDTTDSGFGPSSAEMRLDEIDLSQSNDEQNETDIDRIPFNSKTVLEKNVESLYEMGSDLNVVQRSQHHDKSFTALSICRSERSKGVLSTSLIGSRTQLGNSPITPQPVINASLSPELENPNRSTSLSNTTDNTARNSMKAEIVDLKRDKRAYSSALLTL